MKLSSLRPVLTALFVAVLFATVLTPPLRAQAAAEHEQAPAQEESQARQGGPERGEAIVPIEHANPQEVANVIRVFGVHVVAHPDLGLVTIQGPREAVEAARAAALKLDVPPAPTKSIQVIAYVLDASKTGPLSGGVPAGLEGVARQLEEVFGYQGVELIDTVAVRVLDGSGGEVTGTLPSSDSRPTMDYRFGFNKAQLLQGERPSVRLGGLLFSAVKTPLETTTDGKSQRAEGVVRLQSDVEVRTGQKAVVGKAAAAGAGAGLILVLEVQVLD